MRRNGVFKHALVKALAIDLEINLVFIPSYSPNLNLIERFWKFTKSKLRTKYYTDFKEFAEIKYF